MTPALHNKSIKNREDLRIYLLQSLKEMKQFL